MITTTTTTKSFGAARGEGEAAGERLRDGDRQSVKGLSVCPLCF